MLKIPFLKTYTCICRLIILGFRDIQKTKQKWVEWHIVGRSKRDRPRKIWQNCNTDEEDKLVDIYKQT